MAKTKLKIRKSISRRFKTTKTGKVLHRASFGRHLRSNKNKSQKRLYKIDQAVPKNIAKKIRKLMGIKKPNLKKEVKVSESQNRTVKQA